MSDNWKDLGCTDPISSSIPILDSISHHLVRNTKTGEEKVVYVEKSQTVGEAIENGQFE